MVQLKLTQKIPKDQSRSFWFSVTRYKITVEEEKDWVDHANTPLDTIVECRGCKKVLLDCEGLPVSTQVDLGNWLIQYREDLLAHSCVRKEREEPNHDAE